MIPFQNRPCSTLLLSIIGTALLVGCAATETAADVPDDPFAPGNATSQRIAADDERPHEGRIVEGPRNITGFAPDSDTIEVDAESVDLRQVFDDLGPVAREWYQHVQTLSNPFFEGRVPGTRGMQIATEYVEFWFREYGLEPAFPTGGGSSEGAGMMANWISYRQPFEFSTFGRRINVTADNVTVAINGEELEEREDFVMLGISASGHVTAPITFVGYGIEDGKDGYSSFDEDTDLTGRIALLFRYEPIGDDGRSKWADRRFSEHSAISDKLRNVRDRGAAGVILVSPPDARDARTGLERMRRSARFGPQLPIPAAQLTIEAANELIQRADPEGRDLLTWRRKADRGEVTTRNLDDDVRITLAGDIDRTGGQGVNEAQNVGGVLRGQGDLADEWIVIGAHYDHVGYGEFGTSPQYRGQLHPGADDNASGTAGLIVLARTLSEAYAEADEDEDLRSILFIAFDAEESGLHGSRHFVNNSTIDQEKIKIMINMDMIGRLRGANLVALGVDTAEGLENLLESHFKRSGMTVSVYPGSSGRSDDANFINNEIPAIHFFTGMHDEYHAPSDKAYTVNPAGARDVLRLIHQITLDFAARPEMLVFNEPRRVRTEDRGYGPVRLGIRPGMGEQAERGVYVDDVSPGTSAEEGGIEPGDIIIGWDDAPLDDMRALFEALQQHEPGDVVSITVLREGEEKILKVKLKAGDG